ncbi:HNH endonuclease [Xenorhabdus sp. PR6a]|uniref:HNH endonuclease n=1 Tax=Xenorhabdus sp. PR6a TaxID=3025877 RepID=UPI002358A2EA|nr:HNH endonuclease [Xenorhabdus sp. PR6a]MDC9582789.1 HNH endonuclease [Xenorhabdus sp. PR6a]
MINEIIYSEHSSKKISEKMEEENFCGRNWGDDDLEVVRREIKDFYIREQKHTCAYCKQEIRSNNGRHWDIEHIISRESVHEFMFEPKNLCVSCPECNQRKGPNKVTHSKARKKPPLNSLDYFIVHPHLDNYEDHIEPVKIGEFYFSKSEKGEKTISICGLNRFYEFAGYNQAVTTDNQILQFANLLSDTTNENQRKSLLRDIATVALRQLTNETSD